MNPVTYTGNGTTQSITGVNFQPDFVWVKSRGFAEDHQLTDSVRGVTKVLQSNLADAESTMTGGLTAFNADGFSVGNQSDFNYNGDTLISWNWKAGGTAVSNTDGSITSSVSANTTAGFSVVSYTGTGSNATIGHGLGVAPSMIINKPLNIVSSWAVGTSSLGFTEVIYLEGTGASFSNSTFWNNTAPASSVFSVGSAPGTDANIAYCFADVKGFSKFGSYTGNGDADGTFVYTGFKPAWVMIKRSSGTQAWIMYDNKRSVFNTTNDILYANTNGAESVDNSVGIDFLSNGFKCRSADDSINSGTYIYMAFAENPLVANTIGGIPTTAR